ncbi:MAG: YqgE/AlgH family protein, partial [Luteimonas sp.]
MSDAATPLANQLLIALPSLADPNFARAVALICQHDEEGAMGIVINRASEYTLGEVFEQMQIGTENDALREQVVLAGGPVHPERGFVLHDGGGVWDCTLSIAENLSLTTSRDILIAMAQGKGPAQAVVALGCAGWGAGQLEFELVEN